MLDQTRLAQDQTLQCSSMTAPNPGSIYEWLAAATSGLVPEAKEKVRAKYADCTEAPGEDPKVANRRFRKMYVTESERDRLLNTVVFAQPWGIYLGLVSAVSVAAAILQWPAREVSIPMATITGVAAFMIFLAVVWAIGRFPRYAFERWGWPGAIGGTRMILASMCTFAALIQIYYLDSQIGFNPFLYWALPFFVAAATFRTRSKWMLYRFTGWARVEATYTPEELDAMAVDVGLMNRAKGV